MASADRTMASSSPGYAYHVFGLAVASVMPLPELLADGTAGDAPDVSITFGSVPETGPATARRIGPFIWATTDQFWVCIPGIARFRIAAGREIVIDHAPGIDADSVRVFLLGTVLGILLAQRGHLLLHGNAIRIGDRCVVCVGPSGAGKSTLAAGFHRRGFALLADDLVMIDEQCRVTPGLPRIKLWGDTTRAMAIDTTPLHRIRPNLEKFSYPVHEGFAEAGAPVRAVYSLATTNDDMVSIERLTGFAKFQEVRANIYRPQFVEAMALRGRTMALCTRLAAMAPVARVTRPMAGFTLDSLIDAILEDVREPG